MPIRNKNSNKKQLRKAAIERKSSNISESERQFLDMVKLPGLPEIHCNESPFDFDHSDDDCKMITDRLPPREFLRMVSLTPYVPKDAEVLREAFEYDHIDTVPYQLPSRKLRTINNKQK